MQLKDNHLRLSRCPHCGVATPALPIFAVEGDWIVAKCRTCSGLMVGQYVPGRNDVLRTCFPSPRMVSEDLPERAREYLRQALESLNSPAASIMVSASALDAILKDKGLIEGSLHQRIEEAVKQGMLTKEIGEWAHHVRLDANSQRHADERDPLPSQADADEAFSYVEAIGQVLYVIPARRRSTNETVSGS